MTERLYDPLSVEELGRNSVRALLEYPEVALPPKVAFNGCGVYAIHYRGNFPAYVHLDRDRPVYVGKAEPAGKRQGRRTGMGGRRLHKRLQEHADSIRSAVNLDRGDLACRWLVLDPVWIGLTEQVLISEYRPVWNVMIDGFGIHNPGRGRRNQKRSQWDTLHPGRPWAEKLVDNDLDGDAIAALVTNDDGRG